ncbi:MAG: tRNA lysidine(34) synthetase TilS [Coriobacteriia bacterium]|nr:tRNA lysidine(34) synthetase TilS [Coriobacteriia bacterium]
MPASQAHTPSSYAPVIAMVSGGSDSVALLMKLLKEPLDLLDGRGKALVERSRIHVLHINHKLREGDADEDEAYVRELCTRFRLSCHVKTVDVRAYMCQINESNVELAAREVRYRLARELAYALADKAKISHDDARILTAHTANDRAETFFMRAIEGASLSGLASIAQKQGIVVRPLLYHKRDELREYLNELGIGWREDKTNEDVTLYRAFVRHKIIPLALEKNPKFIENISNSMDLIADEDTFMDTTSKDAYTFALEEQNEGFIALDSGKLVLLHTAIARRVVREALTQIASENARFSSRHISAALEGIHHRPFSVSLPGDIEVRREFDDLVFRNTTIELDRAAHQVIRVPGKKDIGYLGTMTARVIEVPPQGDPMFLATSLSIPYEKNPHFRPIIFDADKAGITEEDLQNGRAELLLCEAQNGDTIAPQGMKEGTKLVMDVMAEARIPLRHRASIPLVKTKDGSQIVCIAGIRLDRAVECSKNSTRLVELSFQM